MKEFIQFTFQIFAISVLVTYVFAVALSPLLIIVWFSGVWR